MDRLYSATKIADNPRIYNSVKQLAELFAANGGCGIFNVQVLESTASGLDKYIDHIIYSRDAGGDKPLLTTFNLALKNMSLMLKKLHLLATIFTKIYLALMKQE